jgi:hypothetical protein
MHADRQRCLRTNTGFSRARNAQRLDILAPTKITLGGQFKLLNCASHLRSVRNLLKYRMHMHVNYHVVEPSLLTVQLHT